MRFISILLTLLATACSTTVEYQGSTNFYNAPEVIGRTGGVLAQAEYGNSTKFVLGELEQAAIFSSQINTRTDQGMSKDNVLTGQVSIGLGEKFEAYYRALADSSDPVGFKFQFYGSSFDKKEEGFKAMLFAGYGPESEDKEKMIASNGSGGSREYDSEINLSLFEAGISFGHRFNKQFIAYILPYYREFKSHTLLTSTSYPRIEFDKLSLIRGVNVGIKFDAVEKVYIMIESGYAHSQYSTRSRRDDYSLGGAFGITPF